MTAHEKRLELARSLVIKAAREVAAHHHMAGTDAQYPNAMVQLARMRRLVNAVLALDVLEDGE